MKKNSGAALTSVIVMFLLVTMIGVPLISMVVYNYQLREYDSGIKEAEYKNEVVMDRIATIIKTEVITAISAAKNTSTENISAITDILVNSYNSAYDNAVDSTATYDDSGNITNLGEVKSKIEENLKGNLKEDYAGVEKDDIIGILDMSLKLDSAQINEENLQKVCNSIFQKRYHDILLGKDDSTSGIFKAIYEDSEYDDLATSRKYGTQELELDESTGKTLASSLSVASKYEDSFGNPWTVYEKGASLGNWLEFSDGRLEIGIESKYKLNSKVPLTTLSATFIIGTPDFNAISSIEQQTVALSNPVLDYGLIIGETLNVDANVKVDGNVLARANGISKRDEIVYDKGIVINSGASFSSIEKGTVNPGNGRIATAGDIIMESNTSLSTGTNPIYYRNLYLGDPNNQENSGSINVAFNGDVLAKDDLEINLNSTVNVSQTEGKNYFGYNDTNDDGPDSSSAIVINSTNIDGININLSNLYLAGRSFIDGVRSTNRVDTKHNPLIYKTGESISVKGNYIAYQTPLINTADYDNDGVSGDYDVDKVKFSSYFMHGKKEGIDEETNLTLNLADNFVTEIKYEDFDSLNKWQYFKEYASKNTIKTPNVNIDSVEYIEGVGFDNSGSSLVGKNNPTGAQATMIAKGSRFEEFTEFFGYYPEDETKRKNNIANWIKFGEEKSALFEANEEIFYTYISSSTKTSKKLAWGTGSANGEDIYIKVLSEAKPINGVIIHNGDLTITNNCNSNIPFVGTIIVTGNLTIEGDVTIVSDKESISELVINNYLGSNAYIGTSSTGEEDYNSNFAQGELLEGDLFKSFTYDGSGTTYVAIDVSDRSNIIDINDLVGITDWKKQGYGRL